MSYLYEELQRLGLINVKSREELLSGVGITRVPKGAPYKWNKNNATFVVYDECGDPWVLHISWLREVMEALGEKGFTLTRGGYVPFSSGAHQFIRDSAKKGGNSP